MCLSPRGSHGHIFRACRRVVGIYRKSSMVHWLLPLDKEANVTGIHLITMKEKIGCWYDLRSVS